MPSNYPPGVTGMEYEISGADFEEECSGTCSFCGKITEGVVSGYQSRRWFWCSECEEVTDLPDDQADYDRRYEELMEEMAAAAEPLFEEDPI